MAQAEDDGLALVLDDKDLMAQVRATLDYTLAHAADNGYLGPKFFEDPVPAHTPQPYDRDLLARLETLLADEFRRTAMHRFRAGNDLVLSALYSYTLLEAPEEQGRHKAHVLPKLSPQYYMLELENKWLWMMRSYAHILRKRPTFFCLNDILGDVSRTSPPVLR